MGWTIFWIICGCGALVAFLAIFWFLNLMSGSGSMNNQMMHKLLKDEARRVADWAFTNYHEMKSQMPNATESEIVKAIFYRDFTGDLGTLPEETRVGIEKFSPSINGLCYHMAFNVGSLLRGVMISRCIQFTFYMDRALEAKGFARITKSQKQPLMESMNIAIPGWENKTPEGPDFPMKDDSEIATATEE